MSYYDDSSLFVAPNGYKTSVLFAQKPMDANGQLAFTRSNDTATRVGPDGLIEKVRTNLLLQSNSFDTTWTNTNTTETSGQAGYDGTNNAWLLESTSASGNIVQTISASGLQTYSVYAKAGTLNWIRVLITASTGNEDRYFNLASGTIGGSTYGPLNSIITSEGNGWYRCSIVYDESTTGVRAYPASADLDTSGLGNILIQDAQLESGDIATDYIPTTTTAVSVGPVANLPRIDYTGGGCGKLLLEPQRTNLVTFSESFNNAAWIKVAGGTGVAPVVTANSVISPDGYQNAETIVFNAGAGTTSTDQSLINQTIATTSGQSYTFSVYLKGSVGGEKIVIRKPNNDYVAVTLTTEWQRFSVTAAAAGASHAAQFGLRQGLSGIGTINSTATIYAYGAQLELGSYVSSYVNTLGSTVTRGADACSKTGIASLIGQSEGTLFLDFIYKPVFDTTQTSYRASISDGTYGGRVSILAENSNTLSVVITGVSLTGSTFPIVDGQRYKVAIGYGATTDVYINGAKVYSYSSGTPTGTYTRFQFSDAVGLASRAFAGPINQALLFKTCLSNSELASLTTL
jgi:hypothetical protein